MSFLFLVSVVLFPVRSRCVFFSCHRIISRDRIYVEQNESMRLLMVWGPADRISSGSFLRGNFSKKFWGWRESVNNSMFARLGTDHEIKNQRFFAILEAMTTG